MPTWVIELWTKYPELVLASVVLLLLFDKSGFLQNLLKQAVRSHEKRKEQQSADHDLLSAEALLRESSKLIDGLRNELTEVRRRHDADIEYYKQELDGVRSAASYQITRPPLLTVSASDIPRDLLLHAQDLLAQPSRASFESAGQLLHIAITHQPDSASALAWQAYWYLLRVANGWSLDVASDIGRATGFADRAVEADDTNAMGHAIQGHIASYLQRDSIRAFRSFSHALQCDPYYARAWLWSSAAHAYLGDGAAAVDMAERALALVRYDPFVCAYSGIASVAYLVDGQYAKAIVASEQCLEKNASYVSAHKVSTIASALAGNYSQARESARRLIAAEPRFTAKLFLLRSPVSQPIIKTYCDALVLAGIPSGSTSC